MCNYESIMSSYTAKLFRGVLPVSVLFLSVCLLIYFLLPSEETESVLDSYAELANAKYSEELESINLNFSSSLSKASFTSPSNLNPSIFSLNFE